MSNQRKFDKCREKRFTRLEIVIFLTTFPWISNTGFMKGVRTPNGLLNIFQDAGEIHISPVPNFHWLS